MPKITLIAGCWAANIGNSFLDLGSMESLQQASPLAKIKITSSLPVWLFDAKDPNRGSVFKRQTGGHLSLINHIDSDFAVFSGMVLSEGFVKRYKEEILDLRKRGVEIIINGGGGRIYTDEEVETFRRFLKEIDIYCFVARDKESYEHYSDLAKYSYEGIDCAFFLNDYFNPTPLNLDQFDVHAFDNIPDPVKQEGGVKVVRAHHSILNLQKNHFRENNTLISDQPADYLNLYGNARETHSDRVHACIATLSFGNKARLYSDTLRVRLFEKVGIEIAEITSHTVSLNNDLVIKAKEEQVKFLSSVLNEKRVS